MIHDIQFRVIEKRRKLNRGGDMLVSSELQYRELKRVTGSDDEKMLQWTRWFKVPVITRFMI